MELTPPFFQQIHNFTPVTYAVNVLRHAVSGAFEGQYPGMMARLAAFLGVAFVLARLGRSRWGEWPNANSLPRAC